MARNYSKKSRAQDPSYAKRRSNAPDTQRNIPIAKVTETNTLGLVQVDRLLSGVNHRLYRQHGNYRCKLKILGGNANTGEIQVFALSNTWYVKNAIQMAKRIHDKAMEEERAMGAQSRWYDFRIADNTGPKDDFVQALRGAPGASTTLTVHPGEYAVSQVEDAAGNLRQFELPAGGSGTGYNILLEYDRTDNAARDPVFELTTGAYDGVDATVEGENLVALSSKGNQPPYANTDLLADIFVQVGQMQRMAVSAGAVHGAGISELSTGFFDAPLGLIWVKQSAADSNVLLELEVAAGNYKGVRMEAY